MNKLGQYSKTLTGDYVNHACLSENQQREPELSVSGRVKVRLYPDIVIRVWHAQQTCHSSFAVAHFNLSAGRV